MRTSDKYLKSTVVEEHTIQVGVGPYTLKGATASYFTFRDAYNDGATVTYRVTNGPNVEIVTGVFNAIANTLSRGTVIVSSNSDNLINWNDNTRLLIRPVRVPVVTPPPVHFDAASSLQSTVSPSVTSRSFNITTIRSNDIIVLHVVINNESATVPVITNISSNPILTWIKRVPTVSGTYNGIYLFGPNSVVSETWYAIASTPGTYTMTIDTNSALAFLNATAVAINGINISSPWDENVSLPALGSNFNASIPTTIEVTGISTQNADTMVLFILDDFDIVGLPVEVGWAGSGYELFKNSENVNAFISLFIETGTSGKILTTQLVSQTIAGRIAEPPFFTSDHYTSGAWIATIDVLKITPY